MPGARPTSSPSKPVGAVAAFALDQADVPTLLNMQLFGFKFTIPSTAASPVKSA